MTTFTITPTGADRGAFVDGEWQADAEVPKYHGIGVQWRVLVAGTENGRIGYGVGEVPPGQQGRQVNQGPLVDGPFAYLFGLSGSITNNPLTGTKADIERERADGRLIEAEPGDILNIDGRDYLIVVSARRYPSLVLLDKVDDPAAEVAHVARLSLFESYHGRV